MLKNVKDSMQTVNKTNEANQMKQEMLDILCCPICKSDLVLSKGTMEDGMIDTGTLTCTGKECGVLYPIVNGAPDMRPPDIR